MKKICYVVTKSITIKAFFIPQLKYLAQNGYSVSVICSPDDELGAMLGDNIRFLPVEMPRGLSVLGSIKAISKLKKIFKKEKFDLVQYSTPNASLYASIASKKAGIKVRNYHLTGLRYLGAQGIFRKILKFIEKKALKNSTHVECECQSNLDFCIKEKLFSKDKAVIVGYGSAGGIDLSRFDIEKAKEYRTEKRRFYAIKDDEIVFGFVGRITKDKGIEELVKAFNMLSQQISNIKLVIVGGLDQNNNLSKDVLSEIENNQSIIKINATPEIEKYYPMLDVLVLPSYREGFGNVVIEAEAMGVPVIVSNIPGPVDAMEDGKTGLIFTVKDVLALSNAMQKALGFDKSYKERAVKFARERFDSNLLNKEILKRKNKLLG